MQMNRNTDATSDSKKIIEKQNRLITELKKDLTYANQSLNCRNNSLKCLCACCLCSCSLNALLSYIATNKYNCKNN